MKRKIAIDAHAIGTNLSGNGVFYYNILVSIVRKYRNDADFIAYISKEGYEKLPDDVKNKIKKVRFFNWYFPLWRYLFLLPYYLFSDKPDILLCQYYGPFLRNCKLVTVIHDISFKRFPQYFTLKDKIRLSLMVRYFAKTSDAVVTVSDFSKKEIAGCYKISEDRIFVVHLGSHLSVGPNKCELPENVSRPYILFVGAIQPRKNLKNVLTAFKEIVLKEYPDVRFVIAGPDGWLYSSFKEEVLNDTILKDKVLFLGYVDKKTLESLYANASLFVYAPFYEGFGLPLLEAMSYGLPVVTSNVTSLPEVAGDGALLVSPESVSEIGNAVLKLLSDPGYRNDMAERALNRAKTFSWERAADSLFNALMKV